MKYKIFGEDKTEKTVFLRLKESKSYKGHIRIIAVDENGEKIYKGNLIRFTKDGEVALMDCINPKIGFKSELEKLKQQEIKEE